jgi:hypothetical protein
MLIVEKCQFDYLSLLDHFACLFAYYPTKYNLTLVLPPVCKIRNPTGTVKNSFEPVLNRSAFFIENMQTSMQNGLKGSNNQIDIFQLLTYR